jgi:hypothetical protein
MPDLNIIGTEMQTAGMAFGKLIQKVGEAVAESSLKLNQTAAATASTLATTKVDVIAAEEVIYGNDGRRKETKVHTRKLPLINFMDPVFYEWSAVRLQGVFETQKLASKTTESTDTTVSSDKSGQGGLSLIFGVGRTTLDYERNSTDYTGTYGRSASFGSMRMNAFLRPKADIGVPKPRLNVQGPQIAILQGEIKPIIAAGILTARTMEVSLQFARSGGAPIAGKALSIETDGVAWEYKDAAASATDANGMVVILLRREFLGETPDTSAQEYVLTVRKGLVSSSSTLKF